MVPWSFLSGLLLLFQDLALRFLRVGDLRNRLVGVESFVIRRIFITAALEAADECDCLVILALLSIIPTRRIVITGFILFGFFHSRLLLFLRIGLPTGNFLSRSVLFFILLLRLLVTSVLLLLLNLSLLLRWLLLSFTFLVAAQEISGTLARLDLLLRFAIGGLRLGFGFLRCTVILLLVL